MDDSSNAQKSPGTQPTSTEALVEDAKNVASNLASDAKEVAGKLADGAKDKLEHTVTTGKDTAAEKIGDVAGAIRETAAAFDDGPLPAIADRAAGELERVADYVQSRTIGELLHDVEAFARREPALFLGGSFALGLIGGRFLKSSGARMAVSAGADDEPRRSRGAIPRDAGDGRGRGDDESRRGNASSPQGSRGSERNGSERNGSERNGSERNGSERNGSERNGRRPDGAKAAPGGRERTQRP